MLSKPCPEPLCFLTVRAGFQNQKNNCQILKRTSSRNLMPPGGLVAVFEIRRAFGLGPCRKCILGRANSMIARKVSMIARKVFHCVHYTSGRSLVQWWHWPRICTGRCGNGFSVNAKLQVTCRSTRTELLNNSTGKTVLQRETT